MKKMYGAMKTEFEVGDLVTFDPFGDESYIGIVVKVWVSLCGECWATVLWNDGDETAEQATIEESCLKFWSEDNERG